MRDRLDALPRFPLLDGSSALQRLAGLEAALTADGVPVPRLYAKRDDLGPVGGGGNKLRKLEYLVGAALADGCDTFVTTGGRQSNHARLTAAACARAGLACELVLADVVPRRDEAYLRNGNVLLDGLFGARVHHLPGDADPLAYAHARAAALGGQGRRAFVVGAGGSSPLGCLGYAACAAEIAEQEDALGMRFAAVMLPNGSSGTHAGLAAGFAALGNDPARLLSFTVLAPRDEAHAATLKLARETLALVSPGTAITAEAVRVDGSQRGDGYGIPTGAMTEAVRLLARSEGLLVDPVYGGKALAGLIATVRAGGYGPDYALLFLMTGGTPGLFAYEPALREHQAAVRTAARKAGPPAP